MDADADVKYAVVLNYKTKVGDLNDETKAKLLFTDGTTKTVKVALATGLTAETDFSTVLAADAAEATTLSQYDIVSYTIGIDDVYELTLVANARTTATASGATKLVSNGKNTFVNNITDVNLAEANAQTTTAADAETVFLVATLKADGTVKSTAAYKGFANVPTITLADTKTTTMSVFMDAKTSNNPATVVFVLDDAGTNVTVSSNNKDIIYTKGSDTDKSYTNALGHFYEYDCFVNGDTTATTIKTESQFTKDTLIYGPSYNSKGILIGQDAFVNADHTTGTDMAYGTTTDSVKNDVIKLGGASYAYAKNVEVYFIDVDGKLVAGTIDEIAYDEDDMVFVKLDEGILTNVYIKVKDTNATVTPAVTAAVNGTPVVSIASGTVKTAGNSLSMHNADHTANVSAKNVVVTYAISTWNPSTNSFNAPMVVSKTVGDVAAGTWIDADGAPVTTGIAAGVTCKVVVTLTSDVASKTFPEQIIFST